MTDAAKLPPQPWMTAPETRAVVAALTARGTEVRFVGGCVRDAAIGRAVTDVDIATHDRPETVTALLRAGFVDAFRALHPDEGGHYSWWSNRGGAREKNVGWRVDYFGVSRRLWPRVRRCAHLKHVLGSDHCPVMLEMEPEE